MDSVLHPALRSSWFTNTVKNESEASQANAVEQAEALLLFVVETTYNSLPTSPEEQKSSSTGPTPIPDQSSSSFLAAACSFTPTFPTNQPLKTRESTAEEVRRYLRFEGGVCSLLDPLGWWKVWIIFPWRIHLLSVYPETLRVIPATCPNGS